MKERWRDREKRGCRNGRREMKVERKSKQVRKEGRGGTERKEDVEMEEEKRNKKGMKDGSEGMGEEGTKRGREEERKGGRKE